MAPVKTDSQQDDLASRRRRKEQLEAARAESLAQALQPSQPARDLLGGLIAGSNGDDTQANSPSTNPKAAAPRREPEGYEPADRSATVAETVGERVDELIERVKADAAAAASEASGSVAQRRPTGTADRAARVALGRTGRPRVAAAARPWTSLPEWRSRRSATASLCLLVGIALLAILLSTGGEPNRPVKLEASRAGVHVARTWTSGLDRPLQSAMSQITADLAATVRATEARIHRTRRKRRASHPAHRSPRASDPESHSTVSGMTSAGSPAAGAPAASSYRSTTSPTESQPVYSQSSNTAPTRPAGPSGSNPLGGLGSCVKGC
jgi:hypothetical protein